MIRRMLSITLLLVGVSLIALSGELARAASSTLVIYAFNYANANGPEWIEIKNISSTTINLSDYATGDEESADEGEGMAMLPDVDLEPGDTLVIRVRDDGSWTFSYSEPDYSIESVTGYTRLTQYDEWDGGPANLSNSEDHIVLLETNGGVGDEEGVDDDEVVDAVCWGSPDKDYIDFDNDDSQDAGDPDIFSEDGCLSDISDGSYRRTSDADTDSQADFESNPTAVDLSDFGASSGISVVVPLGVGMLGLGVITWRRRK